MALLARAGMGLLRLGGKGLRGTGRLGWKGVKYGTLGAVAVSGATPAVAAAGKVGGAFSSVGKGVGRGVGRMFGSMRGGGGSGGGGPPKVGGPSRGDSGLLAVGLLFQIHQEVAAIKGLMLQQAPESEERERQFEEAQRHKELIAALSRLGGGGTDSGMRQRTWQDWLKSVLGGLLALSGLALLPELLKSIPGFVDGIQVIFDKLSTIFDDMLAFFMGLKIATKKVNVRQQKATVKAQNKAAKQANKAVRTGKNTIMDEKARLAAEEKARLAKQALADEKARSARALKLEREAAQTREDKLKKKLKEQKEKVANEKKVAAQKLKDERIRAANALRVEKATAAREAARIAEIAKNERAEAKKLATERDKRARADRVANRGLITTNADKIKANTAAIENNTREHKINADKIVRQGAPKTSGQGHPAMRPAVTGAQTAYERGWSRIWGDREGRMQGRHPSTVSTKAPAVTTKPFTSPTNILQQNVRSVSLLTPAEKVTLANQGYAIAKDNVLYDKETGRMTPARTAAQILRQLEFNRVAKVVRGATGTGGFAGETGSRAPVTGTGQAPTGGTQKYTPIFDAHVKQQAAANAAAEKAAAAKLQAAAADSHDRNRSRIGKVWGSTISAVGRANAGRKAIKLKVQGLGNKFTYVVGQGWFRAGALIATSFLVVKYVFDEVSNHYMKEYLPALNKAPKKNGMPDPDSGPVKQARLKLQEAFNVAAGIVSIGVSGAVVGAAIGGFIAGIFAAFVTFITAGIGAGFAPILVFGGALAGGVMGFGMGMDGGAQLISALQSMGIDTSGGTIGMTGDKLAQLVKNPTIHRWLESAFYSQLSAENQALMEATAGDKKRGLKSSLDRTMTGVSAWESYEKGKYADLGTMGHLNFGNVQPGKMLRLQDRNLGMVRLFYRNGERFTAQYNNNNKTNLTVHELARKLFGTTDTWTKRNRFMAEWHPNPLFQDMIRPLMKDPDLKMSLSALKENWTPSKSGNFFTQDVWHDTSAAVPSSTPKKGAWKQSQDWLGDAMWAMFGKTTDLERSLEADAAARRNASAFLKSGTKQSLAGILIKKIRNTEEQLKTKTEGRHKERLTIQIDDMYNRLHRMVGGVGDVNKTVIIPYTQAVIDSSTTSNNLDSTITKVKSGPTVVMPAPTTSMAGYSGWRYP